MKVKEIVDAWREDVKIDDTELDRAALNVPILHAKYLGILSRQMFISIWTQMKNYRKQTRKKRI